MYLDSNLLKYKHSQIQTFNSFDLFISIFKLLSNKKVKENNNIFFQYFRTKVTCG